MGRKASGHFCWCCGTSTPNEAFSGKGRARALCKRCSKLGPAELAYRQEIQNLDRLVDWDGLVRKKQRTTFARYLEHSDPRVRAHAQEIARDDARIREEFARDLELAQRDDVDGREDGPFGEDERPVDPSWPQDGDCPLWADRWQWT